MAKTQIDFCDGLHRTWKCLALGPPHESLEINRKSHPATYIRANIEKMTISQSWWFDIAFFKAWYNPNQLSSVVLTEKDFRIIEIYVLWSGMNAFVFFSSMLATQCNAMQHSSNFRRIWLRPKSICSGWHPPLWKCDSSCEHKSINGSSRSQHLLWPTHKLKNASCGVHHTNHSESLNHNKDLNDT